MSLNGQRFTPLEMLAKLVSFDTVSSKSNLPLIAFVESYLQSWNVPYVRVPNEAGESALGDVIADAWRTGAPMDAARWT